MALHDLNWTVHKIFTIVRTSRLESVCLSDFWQENKGFSKRSRVLDTQFVEYNAGGNWMRALCHLLFGKKKCPVCALILWGQHQERELLTLNILQNVTTLTITNTGKNVMKWCSPSENKVSCPGRVKRLLTCLYKRNLLLSQRLWDYDHIENCNPMIPTTSII